MLCFVFLFSRTRLSMSVLKYSIDFPELDEDEPLTFESTKGLYGESYSGFFCLKKNDFWLFHREK